MVRALAFDVFGTVVDWRASLIGDLREFGNRQGVQRDWAVFADNWRAGYVDRPLEWGQPGRNRVPFEPGEFDVMATDLVDLADKF